MQKGMATEILWFALFLLVVAISFILAKKSMSDFGEIPSPKGGEYGLFLIRKPENLTPALLDSIHEGGVKEGLIIALERLFKGRETALVIFGPLRVLTNYLDKLNLLQLEDYTNLSRDHISSWEVGFKNQSHAVPDNPFKNFPTIYETEKFFFQLLLNPKSPKGEGKVFLGQIRAVLFSPHSQRRGKLTATLQNLNHLTKIPRPYSAGQIFDFYVSRSFFRGKFNLNLRSSQVVKLIELTS